MSRRYRVPIEERCQVKGCFVEYGLIYLSRRICDWHWDKLADNRAVLYEALNVPKKLRQINVVKQEIQRPPEPSPVN